MEALAKNEVLQIVRQRWFELAEQYIFRLFIPFFQLV